MVTANDRTGKREVESIPDKVVATYGRARRSGNKRRLVEFAASGRLSVLDTIFSTPKRGISLTCSKAPTAVRVNIDLINPDSPGGPKVSTQNLVLANVRLLGRVTPNRRGRNNSRQYPHQHRRTTVGGPAPSPQRL